MPVTEGVVHEREMNSLSMLTAAVVLAIVTMTFGAIIAVFVVRSEGQLWGRAPVPHILWLSTAVLLASSAILERGRRHIAADLRCQAFREFCLTTALGAGFLLCQIAAWIQVLHSGIVLAKNPHSWFVFLFTALHGLHIVLGLGGLGLLLFRTREPVSGRKYRMKTRVLANGVSLFWHYLDFLWIVLFGLLLFWRR